MLQSWPARAVWSLKSIRLSVSTVQVSKSSFQMNHQRGMSTSGDVTQQPDELIAAQALST